MLAIIIFILIILLLLAVLIRLNFEFSLTFDAQMGGIVSILLFSNIKIINISFAFAMLRKDNYSKLYFKLGKREIKEIDIKKLFEKFLNRDKKNSKISFLKLINFKLIRFTALIGMQDAFELVMLCGALKNALKLFLPFISQENLVFVHPAFNSDGLLINLEGIGKIKSENIIINKRKKESDNKKGGKNVSISESASN